MPVIIHSRNAFRDCVNIIDESDMDWNKVVFHCFSESTKEIMEINHRSGWVSFTGILTYKANEHLREALRATNLDRLMLETDSPYLSPIPKRGKENEPSYLPYLGSVAAKTLGLNEQEFAKQIFGNSTDFYDCHLNTKD
jgi:TatD DNase family protein